MLLKLVRVASRLSPPMIVLIEYKVAFEVQITPSVVFSIWCNVLIIVFAIYIFWTAWAQHGWTEWIALTSDLVENGIELIMDHKWTGSTVSTTDNGRGLLLLSWAILAGFNQVGIDLIINPNLSLLSLLLQMCATIKIRIEIVIWVWIGCRFSFMKLRSWHGKIYKYRRKITRIKLITLQIWVRHLLMTLMGLSKKVIVCNGFRFGETGTLARLLCAWD